jgi:phosphogluconate dehydratase
MPELHKLTPSLASLQSKGFKVALVTDGRMSGASGSVPAAIHVTPEALSGGALGRVRNGDIIRLDCHAGVLEARVPEDLWRQRELPVMNRSKNEYGMGRELFASLRRVAGDAESGAVSLM